MGQKVHQIMNLALAKKEGPCIPSERVCMGLGWRWVAWVLRKQRVGLSSCICCLLLLCSLYVLHQAIQRNTECSLSLRWCLVSSHGRARSQTRRRMSLQRQLSETYISFALVSGWIQWQEDCCFIDEIRDPSKPNLVSTPRYKTPRSRKCFLFEKEGRNKSKRGGAGDS